jgi:hypothetical protein
LPSGVEQHIALRCQDASYQSTCCEGSPSSHLFGGDVDLIPSKPGASPNVACMPRDNDTRGIDSHVGSNGPGAILNRIFVSAYAAGSAGCLLSGSACAGTAGGDVSD